jgi:dTDP-4-amino-4,6-dideoxygalactose transaminase
MDVGQIEAAVTGRTRAILPVHLYGAPAPMEEILAIADRRRLAVVEDCAQAIGTKIGDRYVGTFGDFGAFSFFPSKNLGAYGDGGVVITNDANRAARLRSLRGHGGRVKYYHEELGVNSRLDEVQAAILRVKLPHLESWVDRRREIASRYNSALANIGSPLPADPPGSRHAFHQYTIRVSERDIVQRKLQEAGVQTMIYYPVPLHLQKVHESLGQKEGSFPQAERAAKEVISLPMFPELRGDDQRSVIEAVRKLVEPVTA